MTAPHAAMLVIAAPFLIAAMYGWMIRSNRREHREIELRRHERSAGLSAEDERLYCGAGVRESVMANDERTPR